LADSRLHDTPLPNFDMDVVLKVTMEEFHEANVLVWIFEGKVP
jgi:hypothetical protein